MTHMSAAARVRLCLQIHGSWVRVHPLWAVCALRPVYVTASRVSAFTMGCVAPCTSVRSPWVECAVLPVYVTATSPCLCKVAFGAQGPLLTLRR